MLGIKYTILFTLQIDLEDKFDYFTQLEINLDLCWYYCAIVWITGFYDVYATRKKLLSVWLDRYIISNVAGFKIQ